MPRSKYVSLSEITGLQTDIMNFVDFWVRDQKKPVPQKEVVLKMKTMEVGQPTTLNALNGLLKKGYLRRAIYYGLRNNTCYVQLRRV